MRLRKIDIPRQKGLRLETSVLNNVVVLQLNHVEFSSTETFFIDWQFNFTVYQHQNMNGVVTKIIN